VSSHKLILLSGLTWRVERGNRSPEVVGLCFSRKSFYGVPEITPNQGDGRLWPGNLASTGVSRALKRRAAQRILAADRHYMFGSIVGSSFCSMTGQANFCRLIPWCSWQHLDLLDLVDTVPPGQSPQLREADLRQPGDRHHVLQACAVSISIFWRRRSS